MCWNKDTYFISTDPQLLDINKIHTFLTHSYWAHGIPKALVEKSIQNSLNFGVYITSGEQVGFARVISDYAAFAYLGDVYIEENYRGKGLSKWLMECIQSHPELQNLRRFCLGTRDAHELYKKYGFKQVAKPENWMEIKKEGLYPVKIS